MDDLKSLTAEELLNRVWNEVWASGWTDTDYLFQELYRRLAPAPAGTGEPPKEEAK